MKKTVFMIITAVILFTAGIAILVSANAATDKVKVTFTAVLTSPCEFPEGYGVFGIAGNSHTWLCEKGRTLDEMSLPVIYCTGDAQIVGWDVDPIGYTVTEDVTFTLTVNNDDTVPAFFRAEDDTGANASCLTIKSITGNRYMEDMASITVFAKKGEKLTEGVTYPYIHPYEVNDFSYTADTFVPDARDYVIDKPAEFVCTMQRSTVPVPEYTVTFGAEFTTPMDVPEGFYLTTNESVTVIRNSILDESLLPDIRFLGDGMTFEGWDLDEDGILVTQDMTVKAKFNNDGGVPVFFQAIDEDGEPVQTFYDPNSDPSYRFYYRKYITVVKKGEVLTEETVPAITESLLYGSEWDESPVGYKADETHTFTLNVKYFYRVRFRAVAANVDEEQYVHRGEAATPPEVKEEKGWLFTGWDADYSSITENMDIRALEYRHGDVDMSGEINTADAVKILRHCADIEPLTDNPLILADANVDETVTTADAVKVLRIAAGMER